jgi:hypothetical protein
VIAKGEKRFEMVAVGKAETESIARCDREFKVGEVEWVLIFEEVEE